MELINIQNLYFKYDKQLILEDINLSIEKNDFLAIIGPNGGGKSTLLKLILGIEKPLKGNITMQNSLSKIGYVPQNTNINIDFPIKVIEVVMMGHIGVKRTLFGYDKSSEQCALNSLKQVGMERFAYKKIGSLSGGQRQRVMIARALCSHPTILLLDEPTASIDVDGQQQIYKLLKELNEYITVVVVTHDISVILEYASKVVHINKKSTYHNKIDTKNILKKNDGHFCEVEMLEMLGNKKGCSC